MKSKKIVALALTAAMAISMASMTAFATTEYKDGSTSKDIKSLTAVVTVSKDDYSAAKTDGKISDNNEIVISDLRTYGGLEDYTKCNTGTKTFLEWAAEKPTAATTTADNEEGKVTLTAKTDGSGDYTVTVYAEWTETADDEQIAKNLKAIDDAAKDEEAAKSRDEQLKAGDKANKAVDNVKTDDGPKTEKATVTGPTAIENSEDLHDFKVVNKDMNDSALAWVYQVTKPDGLVSTRNARVTLEAPKGYNPKDYKVAVYHVKGYCTYEKVKGLDIAKTDVTFWANDMSPYVLVLTPKDAVAGTSTGNPSTGDFSAVPVAMLAAAALGATGFVAYKKRKAE